MNRFILSALIAIFAFAFSGTGVGQTPDPAQKAANKAAVQAAHTTNNKKGDKLYPKYGTYPGAIFAKGRATGSDEQRGLIAWTSSQGVDPGTIIQPKPSAIDINPTMQGGEGSNVFKGYLANFTPNDNDKAAVAKYNEWRAHQRG